MTRRPLRDGRRLRTGRARRRSRRTCTTTSPAAPGDEWTLAENRRAFDRWSAPAAVPARASATRTRRRSILGSPLVVPGAGGAVGVPAHGAPRRRAGDRARGRRGGDDHGRVARPPSTSSRTIASAADGPKWWQLYVVRATAARTGEMLARVAAAGLRGDLLDGRLPGDRPAAPRHAERVRAADGPARSAISCTTRR